MTPWRVLTYCGHSSQVDLWALAWSPNGQFIASGGTDQIVQVWDARTGERLLTYRGHVDQPPMPGWAYPYAIRALASAPICVLLYEGGTWGTMGAGAFDRRT